MDLWIVVKMILSYLNKTSNVEFYKNVSVNFPKRHCS